jgi:hypothetical protein
MVAAQMSPRSRAGDGQQERVRRVGFETLARGKGSWGTTRWGVEKLRDIFRTKRNGRMLGTHALPAFSSGTSTSAVTVRVWYVSDRPFTSSTAFGPFSSSLSPFVHCITESLPVPPHNPLHDTLFSVSFPPPVTLLCFVSSIIATLAVVVVIPTRPSAPRPREAPNPGSLG